MTPIQRRPCGPDLIDSEDTEDGRLISAQMPTIGQPETAIKYGSLAQPRRTLDHGEVHPCSRSPQTEGHGAAALECLNGKEATPWY